MQLREDPAACETGGAHNTYIDDLTVAVCMIHAGSAVPRSAVPEILAFIRAAIDDNLITARRTAQARVQIVSAGRGRTADS